jgi:hypothetical protein
VPDHLLKAQLSAIWSRLVLASPFDVFLSERLVEIPNTPWPGRVPAGVLRPVQDIPWISGGRVENASQQIRRSAGQNENAAENAIGMIGMDCEVLLKGGQGRF